MMWKGRTEGGSSWQCLSPPSPYLDSAYRQLVRQQHKSIALNNRRKVLQVNHDSMLKQIENNHNRWNRLQSIKENHSLEIAKVGQHAHIKHQQTLTRKMHNQENRQLHLRQMSSVALEKAEDISRIKKEALMLRKENQKLIEQNRQAEIEKKRQIRNKIHEDILESRSTIRNFFAQKHESVVAANSQEVRDLNLKRAKQELESINKAGNQVADMEKDLRDLRHDLYESRVSPGGKREVANEVMKYEYEERHPLVRRIENTMNKYTKLV